MMSQPRGDQSEADQSEGDRSGRKPNDRFDDEPLRPEDLLAIDDVCDQFEASWQAGNGEPDMDAFLVSVRPELRATAREELFAVAHHWRTERERSSGAEPPLATDGKTGATQLTEAIYTRLRYQFQLERRLGSGATGEVWKATRRQTGEIVAIKIPHPSLLGSLTALIRFCREARWQARLRHPRIGAPEEVVMAGELPVLVSRYIDGVSLKDYLRQCHLSVDQAVELVVQLADGLEYAHAMGIVHRDLKPANVMLERLPDGQIDPACPVIVDFGLAIAVDQSTVTHDSQALGTPAYMSPEQAKGGSHAAGVPSDIYSLGVILFESLTGQLPIEGVDIPTLLHNVIYDSPHPLRSIQRNLPADLEQVCAACLSKAPRDRYQSARDLADDLRRWRRHETIRMRRPSAVSRLAQWSKRHPAVVTSIVSIFLALTATTLLIVRESYLERLQVAYNKSTSAMHSAKNAQQTLQSHLVAYRMGRIGAYWRLNNPEQARSLLEECSPLQRTWEWRYFNGLVNRYHRELRHSRDSDEGMYSVRALAATTNGATLFSGSRAGTIYRWNLESTSDEPELFASQPEGIMAIACSPDDRLICYGDNGGEFFLRHISGDSRAVHSLTIPGLAIHAVAFSPDSKRVAIGGGKPVSESFLSETGFLIVVDVESGKEIYRDMSLDRCVVDLDFHPTGDRLLAAGGVASSHPDSLRSHGTLWLWNTSTWTHQTFPVSRIVRGIDWSPTNHDLFAVSTGNGSRAFWSASKGGQVDQLPPLASGGMACQFSPDGRVLATASDDGTCWLWNVPEEQALVSYHAHSEGVSSLVFAANNQLITGGLDEFIRFWDATPSPAPSTELHQLGKFASSTQYRDHILLAINDVDSGTGRVYSIQFAKQLSEFNLKLLFEFPIPVLSIATATHGDDTLAIILRDATLTRLQLKDEFFTDSYDVSQQTEPVFQSLPFHVEDDFILSRLQMVQCPGRTIINVPDFATIQSSSWLNHNRVWSLSNGQSDFDTNTESNFGTGRCLAVSPDGQFLATANDQSMASLWTGNPFQVTYTLRGHERVISAFSFRPDGRQFATGSWDRSVLIWSLDDRTSILKLTGHTGNVLAIAFHPTEPRIFTAGADRQIRVWDAATGLETATLTGHQYPVTHLYFDSNGDTLLSIDDSGQVRCW